MLDRQKQFKITIRISALTPQGVFLLSLLAVSQAVAQAWAPWLVWAAPLQLMGFQRSHPSPPTVGQGLKGSHTDHFEHGCWQEWGLQDQLHQTSPFLARQHPSHLVGRVQEESYVVSSKMSPHCQHQSPVHVPAVVLCAGTGNSWLLCHGGGEGTVRLGMCCLNLTFLFTEPQSVSWVISLRAPFRSALGPVSIGQSRTGVSVTLRARLYHKVELGMEPGSSQQEEVGMGPNWL